MSKAGCVDLFPYTDENLRKFKLQNVKRQDLVEALEEANGEFVQT